MNTQMLKNILDALMTINVRGNDAITMSNCLQALQQVITETDAATQMAAAAPAVETMSEDAE